MKKKPISEVIDQMPPKPAKGALGRISRKKKADAPSSEYPLVELSRLTKQHNAWTRKAVAIRSMSSDRKVREDDADRGLKKGDTIKCNLPDDVRVQMGDVADGLVRQCGQLKSAMHKQLRQLPIYEVYLGGLFGIGPIIGGYLVTGLDPAHKEKLGLGATKSSAWRMRCGLAVVDGAMVRRSAGAKNTYSSELRTRIFQFFQAMWKNRGHDPQNKYIAIWDNYVTRIQNSERVLDRGVDKLGKWTGKIVNGRGKTVSARGFAHSGGWHKAADVFIEDLYIVWRAVAGLPVWPSYYTAKLAVGDDGQHYAHGGKLSVCAPKTLTVEEALSCVGFVDRRKLGKVIELELSEEDDDCEMDAAAEE